MKLIQALLTVSLASAAPLSSRGKLFNSKVRSPLRSNTRMPNVVSRASEVSEATATEVVPEPVKEKWGYAAGSAPMGKYWDPLGFSKDKSESEMKRLREAEITHSRVAMLAFLGFMFQESLIDRPLFWSPEKGPIEGPAIYHFQQVAERFPLFWLATIPFFAFFENKRARIGWQDPTKGGDLFGINEKYEPGDFGFDPFMAYPYDNKGKAEMKQKELNNGRLAMLAVAGIMAQELVNGKTVWGNFGIPNLVPPHGPY
eukprot:CAMPEP_0167764326 /NCGR_PEP_ID=MMETSP0110_2-20121227/13961_1 /TAXON_ID=629695 /ORGANISM="Gymnochlora sp., Strain CCMP2014" /LENGTH=256 /DNA_ID=CAMNT_0007651699 /DNA_START=67 /DNA_END=837 /DNA_ORIENTATION=+